MSYVQFALALLFVLALIGAAAIVARRFGLGHAARPAGRRRRLSVEEVLPLDGGGWCSAGSSSAASGLPSIIRISASRAPSLAFSDGDARVKPLQQRRRAVEDIHLHDPLGKPADHRSLCHRPASAP